MNMKAALQHPSNTRYGYKFSLRNLWLPVRVSPRLPVKPGMMRAAAQQHTGGGSTQEPGDATDVGRIFQQHKLLMESGFSYDQASLILQITERRVLVSHQPAGAKQETAVTTPPEPGPAAVVSHNNSSSSNDSAAAPQPLQRPPLLKSFEDRLSFLELELLKQTLAAPQHYLEPSPPATTAAAAAQYQPAASVEQGPPGAAGMYAAEPWLQSPEAPGLVSHPELLEPEVLAIAQALLIRKGLPYSASSSSWQHFQQQQQQQQQQQSVKTPSSIWGRRHAVQQLRAKPWRYRDEDLAAAERAGAIAHDSFLASRYPMNHDGSMVRSGSRRAVGFSEAGFVGPDEQADLTAYEPSGWAVAGTILVVYAGVLLTFFALVAGSAEGTAGLDAAELSMLMW